MTPMIFIYDCACGSHGWHLAAERTISRCPACGSRDLGWSQRGLGWVMWLDATLNTTVHRRLLLIAALGFSLGFAFAHWSPL